MRKKVLVIGGGASGMVAAIVAARNGSDVDIFEQQNELGKKILATGNGRCNLTNLSITDTDYYCEEREFIHTFIEKYPSESVLDFFESIGILTKERKGYVYPLTDQASSIRKALVDELSALNVTVHLEAAIESIHMRKISDSYEVCTKDACYSGDSVILATGGKAGLTNQFAFDGFLLITQTNHIISKTSPALVSLRGREKFYKKIAGVRTDASITILINDEAIRTETGELQIIESGISGIPVFQISRIASQALEENRLRREEYNIVKVRIDLLPSITEYELKELFTKRIEKFKERKMDSFLNGIVKDKLATFLLERVGIEGNARICDVEQTKFIELNTLLKNLEVKIEGTKEYSYAQVTAGGVPLSQVTDSLESIYHPNFFITGELLDVDGICGGYNLHFAWATGMLVGEQSAKWNHKNRRIYD